MTEFDEQEADFSRLLRESPFDDAARPEHREALRQRVLREFDRSLATTKPIRPWKQTFHSWRQVMRRPIPRLIAISIVCLTVIAPWLFFPSHQTAFAFNNLATAIVEAKTAKFKIEVTTEGMPAQKMQGYYLAPEKYRMELSLLGAGSIAITDDAVGKQLVLMPLTKTAVLTTGKGKPKDQPSNDPFTRLRELLSKNRDSKENPFKPIGEKEIDGKPATGFQSDTGLGRFTIWGDPTTGQLLRVESTFRNYPKQIEAVMSDFELNVDLDEKLFDLTPPSDYKVQSTEVDLSPALEQDFISALKICGKISGGELPSSISFLEPMAFFFKHSKERLEELKKDGKSEDFNQLSKEIQPIQRGFTFAMELPDSADAHYAGKGVKQGTPDRPIFWYKPKDSTRYRIIYADLSVKESDAAPKINEAIRLIKK